MGEKDKSIQLGAGELYIDGELLTEIPEGSLEATEPEEVPAIVRTSSSMEFSATLELTATEFEFLAEVARESAKAWTRFMWEYYNTVLIACQNPRVAHLVRHGKTARVRKKNWRRACRLAEGRVNIVVDEEGEKDATV